MGKRWNNPDYLSELAAAEGAPELIKFWRSPVFGDKFYNIPAFLLPRLSAMAIEVPSTNTGHRIYYERAHCLVVLALIARETDLAGLRLTEPPTKAERNLGSALGQAFHQGCSLADVAFAVGLPPGQIVAIGKRTIRRSGWLSRIAADSDVIRGGEVGGLDP